MTTFEQHVKKDDASLAALVDGNTAFALDLYRKLRTVEGNLFLSPYSISTALAMTYAGARGNTQAQMAQALHFTLYEPQLHAAFASLEARLADIAATGAIQLRVANALWPHQDYALREAFLALVRQCYGVQITPLDYAAAEKARDTINAWVEEKTAHKIRDMIPPGLLNALTRLVLVNAIYFKGDWARQFDPQATGDAPFWIAPDEQVQVPMMRQKREFWYGEYDGLQALKLPYADYGLSMLLLLPKERDGLAALEERLTVENLAQWTRRLWHSEVRVFLPRFEITFSFEVNDPLQDLGMIDAFGGQADFSAMDDKKLLYISAVLHKAFVAVNEQGTEAAAATAIVTTALSPPMPAPVFCADHPFVFMILEENTGSILFLGRVVNPA